MTLVPMPRGMLAGKAPHGAPCTHCGACCFAKKCALGRLIFGGEEGPCPALQFDDEKKSRCGVLDMVRPEFREATALLIGSGVGCDARFNGEPPRELFYAELARWDWINREALAKAKKLWGLPCKK